MTIRVLMSIVKLSVDKLAKVCYEMKKNIIFWSLPDILVITLKRFSNMNRKNKSLIDFPLYDLDLSKYVVGYNKSSYVYDLYGVCNHSGGVSGGHYTAHVKNANGNWYNFNDTNVSRISENKIVSTMAHIVFFTVKYHKLLYNEFRSFTNKKFSIFISTSK